MAAKKKATKRKPNAAFMKPMNPDAALSRYATEKGWPTMALNPASIKAQQRIVRREAKTVGKTKPRA